MENLSDIQLRPIQVVNLSTGVIVPYVNNSRTHSKAQIAKIAGSIKEFGFNDPIAIDKDNCIIAGHGRLEAAKLLGLNEVPTIQLGHLSKSQQKAYILAHNRIALDAGWDEEILKLELNDIDDLGFDIDLIGFNDKELDKLLAEDDKESGLIEDDEVPALTIEREPVSKASDVWLLGEHRLMCGDSTFVDSVEKLLAGNKPILMVTDPPYGVKYDPEWRDQADLGVGERSKGRVENDDRMDWTDAYALFPGSVAYVWHAGLFSVDVALHLKSCDFKLISQIIWVKQHFAISSGDYHWKHEPCWYAVKKGSNHNWQGARDQSTAWEISNNNSFGNQNKEETWGHGTQKPIECMARPITNNTNVGDWVYDPFGGSGTTLVACEKLARKCLMMEISPAYCDVIINRWQQFSGKKAILEATGKTFEDILHG